MLAFLSDYGTHICLGSTAVYVCAWYVRQWIKGKDIFGP